jgi:hypothetical protein
MRVQDLDAKSTVAGSDELIITDSAHKSWRTTFANFLASITSLASLVVTTLFQVTGDTELADTEINGDLEVNGNIYQNGQAYETHAEKVYTKDDVINLRDGAVSALPSGEYAGVIAKHYDADGNDGALVFNKTGEARVGDYTKTSVTVYSPDGENFFTDSEMTEAAVIPAGITPTLVSGTEYSYETVDDDTEPLLTRDELASMTGKGILIWDAVRKKAKTAAVPNTEKMVPVSNADGSFSWAKYSEAAVFRFTTMAAAQTALAIPEGQEGYIPDNGIIIVDELNPHVIGEEIE